MSFDNVDRRYGSAPKAAPESAATKESDLTAGAPQQPFETWARLEIMGHRTHYGLIREIEVFGTKMLRIDTIGDDAGTHVYGAAAIYGIAVMTEEDCRKAAAPYTSRPRLTHVPYERKYDADDFEDENPF